jgi:uncharacterized surface protein with fasciclin (FAS1) repeats
MKNYILIILIAFAFAACTQSSGEASTASTADNTPAKGQSSVQDDLSNPNILQVAISSADHTTLVAGVQATKLEDVLSNAGPLTVFAPNNAAFDKLPEGTLETLLKEENLPTLARIIKGHASPGSFTKDNLKDGQNVYMATGRYVKVVRQGDDVFVDGAKILGSVKASNGIVHVVDAVILEPEK